MAIVAALVFAFSAQIASADCSDKARALGKCPHPKTLTAKSNAPEMGAVPLTHHNSPQTTPKRVKGPVIGPSPIQHSGNNALNPQPIPPGHPIHPLPPPGDQHDGSGH
jgi:hypothetical protein